jgi:hypothetical protein
LEVKARPFLDWINSVKGRSGKIDPKGELSDEVLDRAEADIQARKEAAERIKAEGLRRKAGK